MSHPESILLNINDNEANRYAVTRMLRAAGFQVLEGGTGAEALRLATEMKPDLAILDVKLPDLNGIEVCRRLKADPRTASIAVLHLSANYIRTENKVEGLESGADGYLTQPVDSAELLATVRSLLRMRQAEEAARAAALQWKTTFDSLGDGVCLVDRGMRVMRANQALLALLGLTKERVLGQPFEALMREALGPVEPLPPSCTGALACREEAVVRLGARWFRVAANPVERAEGEVTGAVRILTDITRHRELEEALRQRAADLAEADRRKDEFLAMLAHELRNPLAAIVNALHLAEATRPEDAESKAMRVMVRQSQHMARMVDDLLDVSRFNRGHIELRRGPVDLRQVVLHSVEARRAAIEEKRLALEVTLPGPGGLWLSGDTTRLEQVVSNLLDNARKYTEPGGHVFVSLMVEAQQGDGPGQAVLRVRDTGIGMSPKLKARVFELFVQGEQQLDRSRGGLGIGLTLVRRLVELHGGQVAVHSEGEGKGSELVVRLPLESRAEAPVAPPAAPVQVEGPRETPRRRVMLVEDNEDTREVLRELLEMWGHRVEVAEDGFKAVELFPRLRPHVALVDLGLPGMDGFQVARRIRESEGGRDVYLVALTGYSGEHRTQAERAGFDLHVVKPVNPDELERLIDELPRARPPASA